MNTTAYQLPPKEVLADKIHGCWIGKNIGGTLGGPLEGKRDIFDVKWYLSDPNGVPLPNDDLDLQLLWLTMVEYYGAEHLTSRHFGMMWMHGIIGPWGEYSNCRQNCHLGFFPPLSGACDNDVLNRSNGAWIRAEIWACLAAGKPDEAIRYAWLDSSCDHMTDGIYAEMFVAAMEAAAFCESDIRKLIEIGLSKIPDQCRLRESIELAISGYDAGKKWQDVRNEIVKLNEDMGWFQAPANVAFVVIGLLYGEGDFAKTVCTAVNCGDDTDCTAATAGALLGIILGAKQIPADWKEPIGDSISVISIDFHGAPLKLPKTLSELTGRVLRLRDIAEARDRRSVTPDADFMSREYAEYLWNRSSYELRFNVLFTEIGVEYLDKPYLTPGKPCRVKVTVTDSITASGVVKCRWRLPENWHCDNTGFAIGTRNYCVGGLVCTITPPEDFSDAMAYLELEVSTNDHAFPTIVTVPFRRTGGTFIAPRFSPALQSDGTRKYAAVANWIKEFDKNN